jgi:hypothetical protein
MIKLLELDERRRAAFGKVGHPEHRRYIVDESPDGTICLIPAAVMSELETRFLLYLPDEVERIREAMAAPDPSRWRPRPARRSS